MQAVAEKEITLEHITPQDKFGTYLCSLYNASTGREESPERALSVLKQLYPSDFTVEDVESLLEVATPKERAADLQYEEYLFHSSQDVCEYEHEV